MPLLAVATGASLNLWPFAVLLISLVAIILLITVLRVHAFLALILAAILAGILSGHFDDKVLKDQPQSFRDKLKTQSHWVQAVELTTVEFGATAGKIGVVIALASVISMCLMESGAADKVVRRFIALFGEKRAGAAIAASSYILSVPIFFDTFFMLLLPLARAMRLRTGKDYLLYVMAICCGGTVTHSLLAPHPGPLAMAETLKVDLGTTIMLGLVVGVIPTMASWFAVKWLNRRLDIPLREAGGVPLADLETIVHKREAELPSFFASIAPVILPILLISLASFVDAATRKPDTFSLLINLCGGQEHFAAVGRVIGFLGNRNIALLLGAVIAMLVLMRQNGVTLARIGDMIGPSFETAGVIILITSAGGAFGLMLKNAGVGEAIKGAVEGHDISLILLSWTVAAVIRIAQGSATVAMLTTAAMIYEILASGTPLPYHHVYIFMAIGFGAMMLSWMNDSGFWVVGKLSGFTEKETLKSWTMVVSVNSVVGLVVCLILSKLVPLV